MQKLRGAWRDRRRILAGWLVKWHTWRAEVDAARGRYHHERAEEYRRIRDGEAAR
ncbi:hypothetical protein [Inquilinus limosus]|uniref:hypothetical protein n=1 Tax=Inquilinus limosus TaxID=171674 RepID=UPI0015C60646|nr:hypothetical protein [Inquilinus limosus]